MKFSDHFRTLYLPMHKKNKRSFIIFMKYIGGIIMEKYEKSYKKVAGQQLDLSTLKLIDWYYFRGASSNRCTE